MDHIAQIRPGSDLGGLVRVWPNASDLEASRCAGIIWPGFCQDATGPLPVSHFQTRFRSSTDVPDNIVQKQPGSNLVLADCVRFWPNGSGPEARRCSRIIRSASGQRFPADPDRMRIGSGMFTGYVRITDTLTRTRRQPLDDNVNTVLNVHRNRKVCQGRGNRNDGGRRRLYWYRCTVTTRMTPALR